jgi:glycine cleavage system transcriptional repressor
MVLIVDVPPESDLEELRRGLDEAGRRVELEALTLSEIEEYGGAGGDPTHVVSVYGADHVGIVHSVSAALASRGVNITDLSTRVLDEESGEPGLYVMLLEVAAGDVDLDEALAGVGSEQGVEVTVRPLERDVL